MNPEPSNTFDGVGRYVMDWRETHPRERSVAGVGQGNASGIGHQPAPGQRLPALRL